MAKQLTYTKIDLIGGDDPDHDAGLWLTKSDDQVEVRVRLPSARGWSEPMMPDKAFSIIEREATTGKVRVVDVDNLWKPTWPAIG